MNEKEEILYLLKTEEGYLHKNVKEDYNNCNYSFTDNPLDAYDFLNYDSHPKYLGIDLINESIENARDACLYLRGYMVKITVSTRISFEENMVEVASMPCYGKKKV